MNKISFLAIALVLVLPATAIAAEKKKEQLEVESWSWGTGAVKPASGGQNELHSNDSAGAAKSSAGQPNDVAQKQKPKQLPAVQKVREAATRADGENK
jgi:hypothetical protein